MSMSGDQELENVETQYPTKLLRAFLVLLAIVSLCTTDRALVFMNSNRLIKGGVGLLMIISELLLIIIAFRTYRQHNDEFSAVIKGLVFITLLYNIGHIVYASIFDADVVYISLYGNPLFQPMFMLPLAIMIGLGQNNYGLLYKSLFYYTLLIIPFLVIWGYVQESIGIGLLFVLSFLRYIPRMWRVFYVIFFVVYIIFCYNHDARAAVLRAVMGLAIFVFSLTKLTEWRVVKVGIMSLVVAVPMYYLFLFATTGYSVFTQMESDKNVEMISAENTGDTRTFLYEEVFDDLTNSEAWLLGKGLNSKYYSSYFDQKNVDADASNRNATEVGILNYLLKGGLIQAGLYLSLLLIAIFNCYFRSNSRAMVLVGSILLAHYLLIFFEEIPRYDLYNVAIWFCIGMSFSPTLLEQDDEFFQDQIDLIFRKA